MQAAVFRQPFQAIAQRAQPEAAAVVLRDAVYVAATQSGSFAEQGYARTIESIDAIAQRHHPDGAFVIEKKIQHVAGADQYRCLIGIHGLHGIGKAPQAMSGKYPERAVGCFPTQVDSVASERENRACLAILEPVQPADGSDPHVASGILAKLQHHE